MLLFLDILLHFAHLALIAVNLFGWILPRLRRINLICLLLTGGSWFVLGLWYGIGYCPLTDWQWQIKLARGETDLPNSYIKYLIDHLTGLNAAPAVIDLSTAVAFFLALTISLVLNIRDLRRRRLSV